ncbi:hypothetical protein RAJCM14343_5849 [Rhodococcus aetherivorans]|uniref:Uncharacterized protein n=1 Tax=Rhodococcus aetherivorans TaxID=191292 RepID=A0ABQ0YVT6_9NOCA|nr:hypothetical protein [Rhodococcus aetherivorans]ETT26285.1 hypothetical protein RR21198_3163 [Rhodococcus rhodochrous ATCC 21198]NGP25881.1 hypothetical protein [Rhodococcus aetherivorans]GES40559.1 hypothetical protein RAJCM14343_5849 [Rhodococcus aetherivorans]
MTIENFDSISLYALPVPAVDTGSIIIAAAAGETDYPESDVVSLTIVSGPVHFQIHLSPDDARALADDLNAAAAVDGADEGGTA